MSTLSSIRSVGDFQQNAPDALREMAETGIPIALVEGGRAVAMVVDPKEWEEAKNTEAMAKLIGRRRRQVAAGKTVPFADGMAEVDAMIEARRGQP